MELKDKHLGSFSTPIAHRLVFGLLFIWTTISSIELSLKKTKRDHAPTNRS